MRYISKIRSFVRQHSGTFLWIGVLSLAISFCSIMPLGMIDFPCFYFDPIDEIEESNDIKISYCVSIFPRQYGGGGIYDAGESSTDSITIPNETIWYGKFFLQRDGSNVIVNDQRLSPGESYTFNRWIQSLNPWLILTAKIEFTNISSDDISINNPVTVLGEVHESWFASPIGPIILAIGIWGSTMRNNDKKGDEQVDET